MNIIIIRNLESQFTVMAYKLQHIRKIKQISPQASVTIIDNEQRLVDEHIGEADIVIFSSLDIAALLKANKLKKVKWFHSSSAGASDVAKVLRNRDILLTNSSGVHPIPIAEHVFTYMLMFSRQFYKSYKVQILQKEWVQNYPFLQVDELYGKTICIVGYGRIGNHIAYLAKAFGMRTIAISHSGKSDVNVDRAYAIEKLPKALSEADFVINSLPLTDETIGIFDKHKFKNMKPSAYFINVGRGQTVVEEDLIKALKTNLIAGAGLDVFTEEPLPKSSPLWNMDNVIITPHYAGWTPRYVDRVIEIFCENLKGYLANTKMPNLVDKVKGY